MPEGDSIVHARDRVTAAVGGKALTRAEIRGRGLTLPRRVTAVESRGKHLLVRFDDGLALRTHLRMHGRWDTYPPGARWRRPPHRARAVLVADDGWTAACFDAPEVEVLTGPGHEQDRLGHLGPDLCAPDADLDAAVARMGRIEPETELGVALLDQRVMAGVGNVFKSEVCFACALDPFVPLHALDDATRHEIVATAARLLRANLGRGRRVTYGRGYAVYGRARLPCPRCGAVIHVRKQGAQARATYWCSGCQRDPRA
jgi:endonuclease VIII